MSKMSHIHACSTKKGVEVIRNLGEQIWRIKRIGLLSYEDMKIIPLCESINVSNELKLIEN